MGSGRRTSVSARDARADRGTKSGSRAKGSARISSGRVAPLYKRLPHGPHRLERVEVIHNQRARIHGAMVEAVARGGYEGTSVKQVIGLAGVSRRSFYEQFANKQECFLVTFDLIARRELAQIKEAYLAADGSLEERTGAAFRRFAQTIEDERNTVVLAALEAQRAGPAGVLHLRKATSACEQMLTCSFAESPNAIPLPMPVVRGIVGGLHGIASRVPAPVSRGGASGTWVRRARRGDAALDAAVPVPRRAGHVRAHGRRPGGPHARDLLRVRPPAAATPKSPAATSARACCRASCASSRTMTTARSAPPRSRTRRTSRSTPSASCSPTSETASSRPST